MKAGTRKLGNYLYIQRQQAAPKERKKLEVN